MKKYLVTLNRPVIIDGGAPELYTIYGLLAPYAENGEEQNAITADEINVYLDYLSAMHLWSIKEEKSFSLWGF